jgi:hypothetical protein
MFWASITPPWHGSDHSQILRIQWGHLLTLIRVSLEGLYRVIRHTQFPSWRRTGIWNFWKPVSPAVTYFQLVA